MTDSTASLGKVFPHVLHLQPFWKRESHYAPQALAGVFAAKAPQPETAEHFVCALSQLICDGQKSGAAYDIISGMKRNAGPMAMRTVYVEFEYDHNDSRRAAAIPFYVMAPVSTMETILPLATSGYKNPPLPAKEIGPLQSAIEKMSRADVRPPYNPVRAEFWLGDICEKVAGLDKRSSPRCLAAGVFDRESGAFASPDKALIEQMLKVSQEFYPAPALAGKADNDDAPLRQPVADPVLAMA